ncbi:MAG: hypothetical protein JO241_10275 [Candidatus Eremiobacteraeota bacterium]|nr:hypothetical protein [Candidatus Eremiobacteraeota bacterium]
MPTRLDFLTSGAIVALAPATVAAAPASSPSPAPTPSMPPLDFDMAAFDKALDTASTKHHRHMFASTKIEGGLAFGQMRGVLDAYRELGIPLSDVHTVAVLYHGGSVLLGFDDVMWTRYFIPLQPHAKKDMVEFAKDFDTVYDAQKTKGNPCLHKTGDKDDSSIETLVAMVDARFFVCNNAAKGFAGFIAHKLKLDAVTVYRDLAAHLVPNAMLVPAGVWALGAVQERFYTYQQSTLQG